MRWKAPNVSFEHLKRLKAKVVLATWACLLIERGSRLFLQSLASWLFSCFSLLDIDALDGRYVSWLACQWWARCTQVCEYLNKPDFLKWRSDPSMLSNSDYLGSCHSSADRCAIAAFPGLWHRATNKTSRIAVKKSDLEGLHGLGWCHCASCSCWCRQGWGFGFHL